MPTVATHPVKLGSPRGSQNSTDSPRSTPLNGVLSSAFKQPSSPNETCPAERAASEQYSVVERSETFGTAPKVATAPTTVTQTCTMVVGFTSTKSVVSSIKSVKPSDEQRASEAAKKKVVTSTTSRLFNLAGKSTRFLSSVNIVGHDDNRARVTQQESQTALLRMSTQSNTEVHAMIRKSIQALPTQISALGDVLSSLEKLRSVGGTSTAVIAQVHKKLAEIFDNTEETPEHVAGNGHIPCATEVPHNLIAFSPLGDRLVTASLGVGCIYRVLGLRSVCTLLHECAEEGSLWCLQWNPVGETIATGSADGLARIFDVRDSADAENHVMQEATKFWRHTSGVREVQWDATGRMLATVSHSDNIARIIHVEKSTEVHLKHGERVRHVRWSPVGDKLATLADDHCAYVFNTCTGEQLGKMQHHLIVDHLDWNKDGSKLATASHDKYARVFNIDTWELEREYLHGDVVRHVEWSPCGEKLATASRDKFARMFNVTTRTQDPQAKWAHQGKIRHVQWSPCGKQLATASSDCKAHVFDVASSKEIAMYRHADSVEHVIWATHGQKIATTCRDGAVRLFNLGQGAELLKLVHGEVVRHVQWSPCGTMVATASFDHFARVFIVPGGFQKHRFDLGTKVRDVQWSPDGTKLATASDDQTVTIFNVETGAKEHAFKHEDRAPNVEWSPCGEYIATACFDKGMRIYNASTGHMIANFSHESDVLHAVWSPAFESGQIATLALRDKCARIYQFKDGDMNPTLCMLEHNDWVLSVSWHPSGEKLATAADDKSVHIFDATVGPTYGAVMDGWVQDDIVRILQWSPSGESLAISSDDDIVSVFEFRSGNRRLKFTLPHQGKIQDIQWCPIGETSMLATASSDNNARIFDMWSGDEVARWDHDHVVRDIRWSPTGDKVGTSCNDWSARIFDARFVVHVSRHYIKAIVGHQLSEEASSAWAGYLEEWKSTFKRRKWNRTLSFPSSHGSSAGDSSTDMRMSVKSSGSAGSSQSYSQKIPQKIQGMLQRRRQSAASCPLSEVMRLPMGSGQLPLQRRAVSGKAVQLNNCAYKHLIFDNGGYTLPPYWSMNISTLHLALYAAIDADQGEQEYVLDNSQLLMGSAGLRYRGSKNMDDKFNKIAHWDSSVHGIEEDGKWLRVGQLYLPLKEQGRQVLVRKDLSASRSSTHIGKTLDMLIKNGAKEALFYSDPLGLNVLDLAIKLKQPAAALDVLLPPIMERTRRDPLHAYRSGFDRSLGRVLGTLTRRGEGNALSNITLTQILEDSCFEADPENFGMLNIQPPPKFARRLTYIRTVGSSNPWAESVHFTSLNLMPEREGISSKLNVPTTLEVVLLADILQPKCGFFEGLCKLQSEEAKEVWQHRAIRALVEYKWNYRARWQFYFLALNYIIFIVCFSWWSCHPDSESEEADGRSGQISFYGTWACLVLIFIVKAKQLVTSCVRRFARRFISNGWNFIAVAQILLTGASLLEFKEIPVTTVRPFAALLVWVNALYYMRGFHITGPYVRTLWHTIVDMVGFLIVFALMQVGFAHALLLTEEVPEDTEWRIFETLKKTYLMGVLGNVEHTEYSKTVRYILLIGSSGIVTIVLLNMLIAAISETFDRLQEHSEASWVKGRAQLIYELELVFGYQNAPSYVIFARINKRADALDEDCERLAHGRLTAIQRMVKTETARMESAVTQVRDQLESLSETTTSQLERLDRRLEFLCSRLASPETQDPSKKFVQERSKQVSMRMRL